MFAVHMAVSGTGKATHEADVAGRWRVKGDEFSLTVDRKSKSRMLEDLRYDTYCKQLQTVQVPSFQFIVAQ